MSSLAAPAPALETAAQAAGLILTPADPGTDFSGNPTARAIIALAGDPSKTQVLELSHVFASDPGADPRNSVALRTYFAEAAQRLRNPRPDVHLTRRGLPLSFGKFQWPFHGSTSGADTFIVHGEVRLETGGEAILHAKVSGSLTQTFAEVLSALEQPFAENFIYNAVRKTLDQGQLELVKSGNRQPVPVTTRYYSAKQQKFIFNDTTAEQRTAYLAAKVYWLSGVLGDGAPVWIVDPRDAQYLNTTADELRKSAEALVREGLLSLAAEPE